MVAVGAYDLSSVTVSDQKKRGQRFAGFNLSAILFDVKIW
jgi:hypothetical protein